MVHIFFIPLIILTAVVSYGIWFKDWAERNYKIGFIPGPQNRQAYLWIQKGIILTGLIMLIIFYVQILLGH
jgi:hypothetical protein